MNKTDQANISVFFRDTTSNYNKMQNNFITGIFSVAGVFNDYMSLKLSREFTYSKKNIIQKIYFLDDNK